MCNSATMKTQDYPWLTAREVGHEFGVTSTRIRQMLLKGQIKGRKATRSVWIVHRDEVERVRRLRNNGK